MTTRPGRRNGGNGTDHLDGGPDTDTCTRASTAARCEDAARSRR